MDIQRALYINGQIPFLGAETLLFPRMWTDSGEARKDNQGNQIRPAQKEVFGWESPPLHDPTCMAWLIDPECFTTRLMRVEVELRGALTYGRTSCDVFGLEQQAGPGRELYEGGGPLARPSGPNAHVAVDVDFDRFWSVVYDSFAFYG